MIVGCGTWEIKFCVAQLFVNSKGETNVSYYVHSDRYGLYMAENWDDESVLWYDTEDEAKKQIWNANECVISRGREIN